MIKITNALDFNNTIQYGKMWFFFFFCIFLVIRSLLLSKYSYGYLILLIPGFCIIYLYNLFICLFICIFNQNLYFCFFFPLTTNQCYHCNTFFVTWAFKQKKKVAVNHHALTVKIIWVDSCILTLHSVLVFKKSYYLNSVSILKNNSLLLRFKFMESLWEILKTKWIINTRNRIIIHLDFNPK